MNNQVLDSLFKIGVSFLFGFACAFLYDQLLLYRLWTKRKRKDVIGDFLYLSFCFFIAFLLVTYGNKGMVRGYMLIDVTLGIFLYFVTLGKVYKRHMCHFLNALMLPVLRAKKRLTILSFHYKMKMNQAVKSKLQLSKKPKKFLHHKSREEDGSAKEKKEKHSCIQEKEK